MLPDELLIILTIACALAAAMIALMVLLKDSRSWTNRWLFVFLIVAASWITLVSFQSQFPAGYEVWFARTAFVAGTGIGLTALAFTRSLTRQSFGLKTSDMIIAGSVVVICYVPGLTVEVYTRSAQGVQLDYGPLYPLVLLAIVYFLARALITIVQVYRRAKSENKLQARIILIGLSLGTLSGILTNVILPNLLQDSTSSRFGFIALIMWSSFLAFAIVQHHFLDIRPVVARAAAYVLAISAITTVFIGIVFLATVTIISPEEAGNVLRPQYFIAVLLTALAFHPFLRFFNRLTDKIFFRDAYDPQQVLDRLGSLLAETVDLDVVKAGSRKILADALRPQFIIIEAVDHKGHELDAHLMEYLKESKEGFIAATTLSSWRNTPMVEALKHQNAAVILGLRTSKKLIGYMSVGYRQSGYAYARQDINLLRIAVDQIAIALQNAMQFQEIKEFSKTLQAKVNEATAELRESNAKLQQLDKVKDEFISMASHQLRTPLTSVKGYLSMVLDGDVGAVAPDQRKLLQEAYSSSQRMVYLIGDFLNISRLQTGKFIVERTSVNIPRVIKEEIDQLHATAARRNIKLVFHVPHSFPPLQIDENKIRQVIMNLIDNAIFYSRPGTDVVIELTAHGQEVHFKVNDTGIGVPLAERHHLFTKFFRATNARSVRPDGTGIGLFMAKKVVVAHGGSVIYEPRGSKGSTFGFSLPLAPLKDQPDQLKQ